MHGKERKEVKAPLFWLLKFDAQAFSIFT